MNYYLLCLTIDLFFGLFSIVIFEDVTSMETYLYEKQNFFGLGRRLFPIRNMVVNMNERDAYPEPLPSSPIVPYGTALKSIYQGVRGRNDTRVFRRKFEHEAGVKGQKVVCEGMFDCIISFLAIESTEAIPILLRGGVGYKHFTALVKAKPGKDLKGQVRAYCKKQDTEKNQ